MTESDPRPRLEVSLRERLELSAVRNPSRPEDRLASVLLLLTDLHSRPAFVGVVRTPHGIHGGQFALPGGHIDGDETPWATAMREAREEVGLTDPVEAFGELGEFNTSASRHRVLVQVGHAPTLSPLRRDPREIDGVFLVPLDRLLDAHRELPRVGDVWTLPIECGYEVDLRPHLVDGELPARGVGHRLKRGERLLEMPCVWGLTARILYSFLETIWLPAREDAALDPES